MGLVPVDLIANINTIETGVKRNVLDELGLLPVPNDPNRGTNRPFFDDLNRIGLVEIRVVVLEISIDVPGIVVFRRVLECDEFIPASVGRDFFEIRALVIEAGDATTLRVNRHPEPRIFQRRPVDSEVRVYGRSAIHHPNHFVTERRNLLRLDQQLICT